MKINTIVSKQNLFLLRFIIPPLLTIFTGKILFELLAFDLPQFNIKLTEYLLSDHYTVSLTLTFQEAKARLMWLSSALLYLFVLGGVAIFLWNILKKTETGCKQFLFMYAILLSVTELLYILWIDPSNSPIKSIFYITFNALGNSTLIGESYLSVIHNILDIINLVSILVPHFVIISACCLLTTNNTDLDQLAEQLTRLKELLKVSSAIMIAGIIHMQLWLSWPLSLLSDFSDIKVLKEIVLSVIKYWSICYSLTIAALYLPTSTFLRNKARAFCASQDNDDCELKLPQWLNDNPFLQSPASQIPQIIAIMGPMLAGSIGPALTDILSL